MCFFKSRLHPFHFNWFTYTNQLFQGKSLWIKQFWPGQLVQSVCIVNIAILLCTSTTTYQYVVVLSMTEIVSQNNFFSEKHRKEVCRTTAQWGHNHSGICNLNLYFQLQFHEIFFNLVFWLFESLRYHRAADSTRHMFWLKTNFKFSWIFF